jgi:hypothetical protein
VVNACGNKGKGEQRKRAGREPHLVDAGEHAGEGGVAARGRHGAQQRAGAAVEGGPQRGQRAQHAAQQDQRADQPADAARCGVWRKHYIRERDGICPKLSANGR